MLLVNAVKSVECAEHIRIGFDKCCLAHLEPLSHFKLHVGDGSR